MSTIKTNRIANEAGAGVNVAGLGKIEDTGKNICTAWVNFDGTTTPPIINDSYNVSSVVRTAIGIFVITFETPMDNATYAVVGTAKTAETNLAVEVLGSYGANTINEVKVSCVYASATASGLVSRPFNIIQVFGGKA